MQKYLYWFIIIVLAVLAFVARCWNLQDVFSEGRIYFAEADAYSRMTRVRMVAEGQGPVIKHHDFENWPQGTTPHTTAPMDWTILALRPVLGGVLAMTPAGQGSVLQNELLDLSGALVGPILGALTCLALAFVLPKADLRERWFTVAAVLLFAVSPIAVHGTLLGRPDHQALLILLLAVALGGEMRLLRGSSRGWAVATGIAWGASFWVSLYEPVILFVVTIAGIALVRRADLLSSNRRVEFTALAVVFILAILIDGWRFQLPESAMREAFGRWSHTIGELRSLDLRSGILWTWLGWLVVLAPIALAWQWRSRPESRAALMLVLASVALTLWQLRWGYFLALALAVTLPLQMRAVPKAWIAWIVFPISLWPLLGDWDRRLYPDDVEQRRRYVALHEQKALREIAEIQRERKAGPFVAPWWLSPPLAYWSRQPGVAGSSHQSLPGIIATARVYLAPDVATALPILRERQVAWILSDAPDRIVPNSIAVLGVTEPEHCLADELARHVTDEPFTGGIIPEGGVPRMIRNQFFQVWRVAPDEPTKPSNP